MHSNAVHCAHANHEERGGKSNPMSRQLSGELRTFENAIKRVMEDEDENIGVPTCIRVAIRGLIRGFEPRTGLPKISTFTGSLSLKCDYFHIETY